MGFKIPERTITLNGFLDPFEGLEVVCTRNVSLDKYLALESAHHEGLLAKMYQSFGDDFIVGWNLEDDDGPIEPTGATMTALPADVCQLIVSTWLQEVAGVPSPLGQPSTNGITQPREVAPPPLDLGSMSTPN